MATTVVKTELAPSSSFTDPSSQVDHHNFNSPAFTQLDNYARPDIHSVTATINWPPASLHESFIRSDAPPPTHKRIRAPTAPTLPTIDSEPVLMQVKNRDMATEESQPNPGDNYFQGSFRDIGAKLKACNDTLGELQQLGVSHIVSLPRLVLVGDQSAGKSSLMSGLAGLNLPRSEGVCTRCPIHIRVSRHHEWSCRVSLQLDYDFDPPSDRQITKEDVTGENRFPPWVRQSRQVKEFMTIYDSDKGDIETVLRWAQVAILNHHQNSDLFIPGTGAIARSRVLAEAAEDTAAKFSPNTVALEIKGPDLPDLSFYDLPGIFRNSAQEEDEYLVQVVENLAREQIQHKDALIIWAVPMNADPETSSTLSIIRDLRAQDRTIGVMTKADLLPTEGNYNQWLSMLRGERHRIGHEYFITSRPTDEALEAQMRWEEALFSERGHDKWPADFLEFQERCGVERLKAALSEKLGKEFAKNLPSIKQKVQTTLKDVNRKLSNLPELPANVELEVRHSLRDFSNIVKDDLKGKEFSADFGKLAEGFRNCLLYTKPKFTLKDRSDTPVLEISDDEDAASVTTPSNNRKRGSSAMDAQTPKRMRPSVAPIPVNGGSFAQRAIGGVKTEDGGSNGNGGNGNGSPLPSTPTRGGRRACPLPPPFDRYVNQGTGFRTIGQVRRDIHASIKPGMPNLVPQEVYEHLCKEAVSHWDQPMLTFLETTMSQIQKVIDHALEKAFTKMKRRLVYKQAKTLMKAFLVQRRRAAYDFLMDIYRMETWQLFTINTDAFLDYQTIETRLLTRYRHVMRWRAFTMDSGPLEFKDWDRMTSDQRTAEEKTQAVELAKMGPDGFEKEIKVAGYVRGYYRLASLRFADHVTLSIISRMLPNIVASVEFHLEEHLGVIGEGSAMACQHLMEEDDATAKKRDTLKTMAEQLRKAEESIEQLELEAENEDAAATEPQWPHGEAPEPGSNDTLDEV